MSDNLGGYMTTKNWSRVASVVSAGGPWPGSLASAVGSRLQTGRPSCHHHHHLLKTITMTSIMTHTPDGPQHPSFYHGFYDYFSPFSLHLKLPCFASKFLEALFIVWSKYLVINHC
ncbi:hypothetical protein PoB_006116200 [Plakobranchus ocellatus]|uniref:Uncharacterized protein n=1 Tax=Plakobranchus ocellatus TaxID=259542 RepID=A0AAV4CRZ7_9GAST|nr:hypothetical protein PoB_006116200 [Plakobranchus ocellatus]